MDQKKTYDEETKNEIGQTISSLLAICDFSVRSSNLIQFEFFFTKEVKWPMELSRRKPKFFIEIKPFTLYVCLPIKTVQGIFLSSISVEVLYLFDTLSKNRWVKTKQKNLFPVEPVVKKLVLLYDFHYARNFANWFYLSTYPELP